MSPREQAESVLLLTRFLEIGRMPTATPEQAQAQLDALNVLEKEIVSFIEHEAPPAVGNS